MFHHENTPSLYFDLSLNLYHCFGCNKGGDVITFVRDSLSLGFEDSVKYLLKKYCADVDLSSLVTDKPEDEEQQRRRETQFLYMEYAYRFYREKYLSDTAEARSCRSYAELDEVSNKGRWNAQFCNMIGLGYSPKSGKDFLNWANSKGLRIDILQELGLVGKSVAR